VRRHHRRLLPVLEYNYKPRRRKRIIAISKSVKNDLVRLSGIPENDVTVIYNGVNLCEFDVAHRNTWRKKIRSDLGVRDDDFLFLFVGNDFRRKGLETLIKVLSKMPKQSTKLIVLGHDAVEQQFFVSLAGTLGLTERVFFIGHSQEVNRFYVAGDAFVFPTLYEAFGLAILEAMASGLPVITSKAAGAAELIAHGVNGLLLDDPKDEDQLINAMRYMSENESLCRRLGESARQKAKNHSWDNVADKTLQLYHELLKRPLS
jgi:UDP-glucose:(heptosyl)LPS alpha-1,3-glucosyltransferase